MNFFSSVTGKLTSWFLQIYAKLVLLLICSVTWPEGEVVHVSEQTRRWLDPTKLSMCDGRTLQTEGCVRKWVNNLNRTYLMWWGRGAVGSEPGLGLYSEVQCIMGNGHIGPPSPPRPWIEWRIDTKTSLGVLGGYWILGSFKWNKQRYVHFFFNFWRTWVPFVGPLIPLFWTSGDISSEFQSQSGFCLIRA